MRTYEHNEAGFRMHWGKPRYWINDVDDGYPYVSHRLHHLPDALGDLGIGKCPLNKRHPLERGARHHQVQWECACL